MSYKVIKEGRPTTIKFVCEFCAQEWIATPNECQIEASGGYFYIKCDCTCCGTTSHRVISKESIAQGLENFRQGDQQSNPDNHSEIQ